MVDNKFKEFIGEQVQILEAKNKIQKGLKGVIVDETKNTFIIKTANGNKRVLKQDLEFLIAGKKIQGKKITKRLEDRIKIRR